MRKSVESTVTGPARPALDPGASPDGQGTAVALPPAAAAISAGNARDAHAPVAAPSTAAHAVSAIEAAVAALDHARSAGRSSVDLQLSFGNATQLAVRVELRDGAVHTTFRTDSAELQHALAREWNVSAPALAASSHEHPVRIAAPVFVRADTDPGSPGSSADGYAQPRHAPAPQPETGRPRFASPAPETAAADRAPIASADLRATGSSLLNTFA